MLDVASEIELFLVAKSARGHGVGGSLWRQAMDYFANCQVARFYLHTDSSCDVSFYDHKGLDCIAHRTASETVARLGGSADGEVPPLFDDMFIYRGKVTA